MISTCFYCQSTPVIASHGVYCPHCHTFQPSFGSWNRHNQHLRLSYYSSILLVACAAVITFYLFFLK